MVETATIIPWQERLNQLRSLRRNGELVSPSGNKARINRLDGALGVWLVDINTRLGGHWEYIIEEGVGLTTMILHFYLQSPPGVEARLFQLAQKLEFTDKNNPYFEDKEEFHSQVMGIVDYLENTFGV